MNSKNTYGNQQHRDLQGKLAHCAEESIHTPETIQNYGTLVVCNTETGEILRHSENARDCLGEANKTLVGHRISDLLGYPASTWQEWSSLAQAGVNLQLASIPLPGKPGVLEIMGHRITAGDTELLVLELIPDVFDKDTPRSDVELLTSLAKCARSLRKGNSVELFTRVSVQAIRDFLGYDRVMLYRFASNWSGEVLAEATAEGVAPRFIGHHFPASDIPPQARDLYTRNLLRVIADVDASSSALIPAADAHTSRPLDQSICLLRQPSAMHLVYLRNMGVRSTLTVSLMNEGKLWGMLSCHHNSPRIPPQHHRYSVQVACELLAEGIVSRLDSLLRIDALEYARRTDRDIDTLEEKLRSASSLHAAWEYLNKAFTKLANVHAVFGRINGQCFGEVHLSKRALLEIEDRLLTVAPGTPIFTDSVRDWGWQHTDSATDLEFAGLVAVAPASDKDTYFVALREEWKHSINWGGRPDQYEAVIRNDGVTVLGARRSFELWVEEVEGRSEAWNTRQVETFVRLANIAWRQHARSALLETRERNRLLGASLDLLHDLVVMTEATPDPSLGYRKITYVNPALCDHSGYARAELIGKSPSIFQGTGTDTTVITRIGNALRSWQASSEKLINYKKDGSPYWVELKIVPIGDETGWITHWISVQRDITETVRLQQELQSKNDRMESVMRATGAGTWSLDLLTGLANFDERAAAIKGYTPEEYSNVTQSALLSSIHPEDLEQLVAARTAHLQKKTQFYEAVYRVRHRNGHWVWVSSRGQVIRWTPDGHPALAIGTYTDVTEFMSLRNQLLTQQKFLNDLTDQLPGAVYQLTRSARGKYTMPFASQVLTKLIGFEPEELREDLSLVYPRLEPSSISALQKSIEDSARDITVWRQRLKLSQRKGNTPATTLQTFAVPQAGPDGSTVWHGFITDISDMVRIEDEILQARTDLEATIAAIPDSLISLDTELNINLAHSPQNIVLGQPVTSLQGQKITELLGNSAIEIFRSALEYADQHGHIKNVEFTVEIGCVLTHFECSIACKPKTGVAAHGGYVVTIRDVTQRKETEQQVALLAYRDSLTGLLNRRALLERLERIHARSLERNIQYAVLFIDLDNFKDLNDAHGHHVGDDLLRQVALRLSLEIRHTDVLARLGGDEFLVVVHELTSQLQAEGVAVRTAQSLIGCMKPRFQLGVLNYEIACSIGVAFGPGAVEVHKVMQHADIAMYQAKASGRDSYYLFDNALQSEITYKSAIAQDLRHAIGRDELLLHYQPIVDQSRVVVGYEALIRWKHPARGLVQPNDFISAAEQNGLIVQIGSWVLQTAVSQLLNWTHDAALDQLYISVNVSALQVQRDDFVEITRSVIERAKIDPKNLKLELTESLMHNDLKKTIEKMRALRSFGLEFSLDDFGTGYSSMSYVRQLPLSQLKIDRSFIVDLPDNTEGAAIATMITQLAKTLRLGVVAEGVETEAQFQYLRSLGCQYFQGYLFGKPAHS